MVDQGRLGSLQTRDLALDRPQPFVLVDRPRSPLEAVVAVAAAHHVGGRRTVVLATLPVDALALVAPVVHTVVTAGALEGCVRQLGPSPPCLLYPRTAVKASALRGATLLRLLRIGAPEPRSRLRSIPSFFRSETIRCAWGLCSLPLASNPA